MPVAARTIKSNNDPHPVEKLMAEAVQTFLSRNADYGDAYRRFGRIMSELFPDGLPQAEDQLDNWNKLGVLCQMVNCLIRFTNSGMTHKDSVRDLGVFSFMMEELVNDPA